MLYQDKPQASPSTSGGIIIGTTPVSGGTSGSVLFVDASGFIAQDNTNFNFNDSSNTLSVANLTVTAMTAGSVLFAGTSGAVNQDNPNLFFDNTNNTLGLGTTRTGAISGTNPGFRILGTGTTSSTSSFEIQKSDTTTSFFVRDDGRVGVGTTAPFAGLTVANTLLTGNNFGNIISITNGLSMGPGMKGFSTRGTLASPTATGTDDYLVFFGGNGYTGGYITNSSGFISINAAENFDASHQGAYIAFWTSPKASAVTAAERMRIFDSGNIGIGTTTDSGNKLAVSGTSVTAPIVQINNSNGTNNAASLVINSTSTGNPNIGFQVSGTNKGGFGWNISDNSISFINFAYSTSDFGLKLLSTGSFLFQDGSSSAARVLFTKDGAVNFTPGTAAMSGSSQTSNMFSITGTMPTSLAAAAFAVDYEITGAGSSSQPSQALRVNYKAGYTGSSATATAVLINQNAGTGSNFNNFDLLNTGITGNIGINAVSIATTTGLNNGGTYFATGGNINVGIIGGANVAKNSATNIGILGIGLNTGTTPIQIGGYFGLNATTPTFASAALMADNGSQTSDIFVARDNGTAIFKILDGGGTLYQRFISAKAATPVTVASTDSGTVYTNEGTSVKIVFNLPTAVANLTYTVVVQDNDGVDIVANTGDTIRFAGTVTAAAGTITSTTIGSSITLVAVNATEWIATSLMGTWA